MAKEASSSGDRIQAEYYYQFADHYSRMMAENGIKTYSNENINKDSDKTEFEDQASENSDGSNEVQENSNISTSNKTTEDNQFDENDNSLETVSFISQPASKSAKLKK